MNSVSPIVSIIVPVYNVEKYLKRCIDSILNQTFSEFELILINDGSEDNSGMICDKYRNKDNRIKVIHQENSGVSAARNAGIEFSKGKYIQFVDPDDYIELDLIEKALNKIINEEAEILFWGFFNEYDNGEIYKVKNYSETVVTNKTKDTFINLYKEDLFGYTWCKLFKASIIKDNKIYFDRKMKFCEDEEFTTHYCKYIKKISIINECKYHYINYEKSRITLTNEPNRQELFNRNKLFIRWKELLGSQYDEYLINKAYGNLRFIFFNIVWGEFDKNKKHNKIKEIKKSAMYKYLEVNKVNFKHNVIFYFIKMNNIFLFKVFNRLCKMLSVDI